MDEYIVRAFYRRMKTAVPHAQALFVLERIFSKWREEHEPFEFSPITLFPWLEVLEKTSPEHLAFLAVTNELETACKFYTSQEYKEKRDLTFKGKEDKWYVVPKYTFLVYYEKALRGLDSKSLRRYPDYLSFLKEKMRKEKLSPLDRIAPNEFFADLYTAFLGEKVSRHNEVALFHCLEFFRIVGKQEAGKKPKYPLAYIEVLLKELYKNTEFLKSLVLDVELCIYD